MLVFGMADAPGFAGVAFLPCCLSHNMPGRQRSGSSTAVLGRSVRPSVAAVVASLSGAPKKGGLGKRKRGHSPARSPSPARSEPGTGGKRPRRSRSQTPSARAASAAPSTGSAAHTRALAALRVRPNVLSPASHPRPSRQLFVWGNGDMGQFGLGTDVVWGHHFACEFV